MQEHLAHHTEQHTATSTKSTGLPSSVAALEHGLLSLYDQLCVLVGHAAHIKAMLLEGVLHNEHQVGHAASY